ncbi:MAG: hypothetical protein IKM75_10655 [Bacteroidales bacterium]|jgi:hypothetical protein|nr:hypothetical protein [Bacteroidales bacterium]MBR6865305.1 hypothetical protein [Bacteroidales bacterium]
MAKTAGKIIFWVVLVLLLAGAAFGYYKFLWVFSDGTKTGELNSLTYTGYIWKTYEGEMILSGYGSKGSIGGSVQSKFFKFSVADKAIAEELRELTGQRVTVHYKEYKGALPWRGYERAIVDRIDNAEPVQTGPSNRLPYDASAEQVFL